MEDLKTTEDKEVYDSKDFYEKPPETSTTSTEIDEFYQDALSASNSNKTIGASTEKFVTTSSFLPQNNTPNTTADLDSIKIQLNDIIVKVGKLQSDIETIAQSRNQLTPQQQSQIPIASSSVGTTTTNKTPNNASLFGLINSKTANSPPNNVLIEGFENRTAYASF